MGMFSQKPEEKAAWAPLPSEPLDREDATDLPERPAADPLALGIDGGTSASISMTTVSMPIDTAGIAASVGASKDEVEGASEQEGPAADEQA